MSFSFHLDMAGDSHPGMLRPHNEDSIAWKAALGLALLADGLGGHNAGEVAAGMATSIIMSNARTALEVANTPRSAYVRSRPDARALLAEIIDGANEAIYEASRAEPAYAGMGTTLVAALFHDRHATIAHVGDSRCYRFRNGALLQLTEDHSVLQTRGGRGLSFSARRWGLQARRVLTRALGVDPAVLAEIAEHEVAAGDVYLLCSDGLSDCVDDDEIASVVGHMESDLQDCCRRLIAKANDAGGPDNISVIIARVSGSR